MVSRKKIANKRNFFIRLNDDNTISIKLPFKISVKSIPNKTKRIPNGMLKRKKRLKKEANKKKKCINSS